MTMTLDTVEPQARAKRLKAHTNALHERLDNRVMAGQPFASRERYGRFLAVQYLFQRDVEAMYADPDLQVLVPDLAERCRLDAVAADLADLGVPVPDEAVKPPRAGGAEALGWLYVSEGSTLGAAFLLKAAEKIGLGEEFGARHLAGAPEGRGLHWRRFTDRLNAVDLSEEEEDAMMRGAEAAFSRVYGLVERYL